jgi:hypothetical protein
MPVTQRAGGTREDPMSERRTRALLVTAFAWTLFVSGAAAEPDRPAAGFRVKHVYRDAVYLEAGSSAGLAEGQILNVNKTASADSAGEFETVAVIHIESTTPISAVGRIVSSNSEVAPGDVASFSPETADELNRQAFLGEAAKYAQVASFTEGIPPEQEIRESLPRPPLPEVNRIRGSIGVDYSSLQVPGSGNSSSQFGYVLRLDGTRLGNSYWSVSGYHRGRLQSINSSQETLTDLINRTYHLSLTYDSPSSPWVAGAGRLYIPWASSLSTLDGFYLGRRVGKETVGIFGGSTPDPTSWNYSPNRQMAGAFVNFDRGSFDELRFTSTSGIALSRIHWHPDRQFAFLENGIFYKYFLSIYSDQEVDLLTASQNSGNGQVTLSRSYFTIRIQPHKIISFDLNENYFRNIPTFDTRLIGTGLLDKFLFQGFSGGIRLALPYRFGVYSNAGRSSSTGDQKPSWNYQYGASAGDILHSHVRAEVRYAKFNSSFGRGTYKSVMLTRDVGEGLRFELEGGQQDLSSILTSQGRARFVHGTADWFVGSRYILGVGLTVYRGQSQNYNQYFLNLAYRFDNHGKRSD